METNRVNPVENNNRLTAPIAEIVEAGGQALPKLTEEVNFFSGENFATIYKSASKFVSSNVKRGTKIMKKHPMEALFLGLGAGALLVAISVPRVRNKLIKTAH